MGGFNREILTRGVFFTLCVLWLSGTISTVKSTTEVPLCSNVTESSTTDSCCLCYENQDGADSCDDNNNNTCPEGYQLFEVTNDLCNQGIDSTTLPPTTTTAATTTTTAVPTTTTTSWTTMNATGSDVTGDVTTGTMTSQTTGSPVRTHFLCHKCYTTEYFNGTSCASCDPLCHACTGPGPENCKPCKVTFNGSCVEACPNTTGIIESKNANNVTNCVAEKLEEEKKFPLIAVIAGAAGGFVVLVIIVVIVIVVVCRRRKTPRERTTMSMIIEEKAAEQKPDPPQSTAPSKRRNYENQPDHGPKFGQAIQQQGDQVLRYTKDPTEKTVKDKKNRKEDDVDTYANMAMIRAASAFGDTKSTSREKLQEQLEHEELKELGDAPRLPVLLRSKVQKKSVLKRMSHKLGLNSKKTTKIKEEEEEEGEVYIDMEQGPMGAKPPIPTPDEDQMEDYENIKMKPSGKKPAKDDDLEDYENTSTLKRTQAGKETKQHEESEDELEDYENMDTVNKEKKTKGKPDDVPEEFEQESYENLAFESDAAKGKVGSATTVKSAPDEEAGVDSVGEDSLEDYENSENFRKNAVAKGTDDADSPYQNFQFKRK